MAIATIKAGLDGHGAKINVNLPVILFQDEKGYFIAHVPALDLSGYGLTEVEAKDSLDYVISEYFEYAIKNNTLHKDLISHGWNLMEKEPINPPLSSLIAHDPLKEVINNTNFKRTTTPVQIPAYC